MNYHSACNMDELIIILHDIKLFGPWQMKKKE